jgi:hypothetical protein
VNPAFRGRTVELEAGPGLSALWPGTDYLLQQVSWSSGQPGGSAGDAGAGSPSAQPHDRSTADFLYYVMPYVEGESLRDRLIREKQPLGDTTRRRV